MSVPRTSASKSIQVYEFWFNFMTNLHNNTLWDRVLAKILVSVFIAGLVVACTTQSTLPSTPVHKITVPDGFRMSYYRAATPDFVPGGTRVHTDEVKKMREAADTVMIDVMGAARYLIEGFDGDWIVSKPRDNIKGGIWIPNVGHGTITPELEKYFKKELVRATKGDKNHKIMFYCVADCWMAWNAVKRAHSYGYTNIYWYPEGTDAWKKAGLPLVDGAPIPLKP
jgi:PQQ-dependent catabolism-associated CXXCW motif protein